MNRGELVDLLLEVARNQKLCVERLERLQLYVAQGDLHSLAMRYRADIHLVQLRLESLETTLRRALETTK